MDEKDQSTTPQHQHDENENDKKRDGVYASQHDAETEEDTASGGPAD